MDFNSQLVDNICYLTMEHVISKEFFYKQTSEGPLLSDNCYRTFIRLGDNSSWLAPKFSKCLLSPITFLQAAITNRETIMFFEKTIGFLSVYFHTFFFFFLFFWLRCVACGILVP